MDEDKKQKIITFVCELYRVDEVQLKSTSRRQPLTEARQVAMFLLRQLVNMSYKQIGATFERDHTTVMHAYQKIEPRIMKEVDMLITQTNEDRELARNKL